MTDGPQELAASHRRGTPPGSMRYFAVLFAATPVRPLLHAFYAFEAELRDTLGASHDIAHIRLQWWNDELTLLADGRPRHPVTIALAPAIEQRPADLARLRGLTRAAALDLACNTYADWAELEGYCVEGAGALQEAIASALTAPSEPHEAERRFAQRLGAAVRQAEMLRDFGHDMRRGLLYLPMSALTGAGLDPHSVPDHPGDPALASLLVGWQTRLAREIEALPALLDARQRSRQAHGIVLAALHRRLLARIRLDGSGLTVRADLPPITRLWTAWRAAVASQRS
jgi:15-cis-phytoene synthase